VGGVPSVDGVSLAGRVPSAPLGSSKARRPCLPRAVIEDRLGSAEAAMGTDVVDPVSALPRESGATKVPVGGGRLVDGRPEAQVGNDRRRP